MSRRIRLFQSDAYAQPQVIPMRSNRRYDSYAQQPQADPGAAAAVIPMCNSRRPIPMPNRITGSNRRPIPTLNRITGSRLLRLPAGYSQPVISNPSAISKTAPGLLNQFQYSAPQGYQPQPGGQDTRPMNSMAVISLVCGAVSVLLSLIGIFIESHPLILAILSGVAGIILGSMAGKTLTETSPQQGKSLATAGLICGIVGALWLFGRRQLPCLLTCTLSSVSQYW